MTIVYGTEAKEIYSRAVSRNTVVPVSGVFESWDMGGAVYKAFKSICGELFVREFFVFDEAKKWVNEGV